MFVIEKMNGALKTSFDRISPENDVLQPNTVNTVVTAAAAVSVFHGQLPNSHKVSILSSETTTTLSTTLTNVSTKHLKKNLPVPSQNDVNKLPKDSAIPVAHQPKKNFKLLCDPALKKGEQKLIRYNGIVGQNDSPILLKDPRIRNPHSQKLPVDLPVPRFVIDDNYVGIPPAIEVSITNLNDNIGLEFLRENILKKYGDVEKVQILHHPLTKQHLGLAKVTFYKTTGASACVEKLNGSSIMGDVLCVFHDPFANSIRNIYHEIVNPTQGLNVPIGREDDDIVLQSESTLQFDNLNENIKTIATKLENGGYQSPIRESLDTRIAHMIRDHKITMKSSVFESIRLRLEKSLLNSSNEHSDEILEIPPSPFLSTSHYTRWYRITKEIEKGADHILIKSLIHEHSDVDDQMDMSLSSNEDFEMSNTNQQQQSSHDYHDGVQQYPSPQFSYLSSQMNGSAKFFNSFVLDHSRDAFGDDRGNHRHHQKSESIEDKRELFHSLMSNTLREATIDFEEILFKDLYKKITENFAFKMFDKWWEEEENRSTKLNDSPIKAVHEMDRRADINIPLFKSRIENLIRDEHASEHLPTPHVHLGLSRGLMAAMPKMPSFKKKPTKISPRTPRYSDSSAEEDEDSQLDEKENRREKVRRRRRLSASSHSVGSGSESESTQSSVSSKSSSSSSSSQFSTQSSQSSVSSSESSEDEESSPESISTQQDKESIVSKQSKRSLSPPSESQISTSQIFTSSQSGSISYSPKSDSLATRSPVRTPVHEDDSHSVQDSQFLDARSDLDDDVQSVSSHHGSTTDTADETLEEIAKLNAIKKLTKKRPKKGKKVPIFKSEEERLEYEASQALMALAGLVDGPVNEIGDDDPIALEHNYARMPIIESPKKRGPKPKKDGEKKKPRNKKVQDENQAPNLYGLGAVATEMRKAKMGGAKTEEFVERDITFLPRDAQQENVLCEDFITHGVDNEDLGYLKRSYELLMKDESPEEDNWWIKEVSWVSHPQTITASSPPKAKKRKEERIHKSGSARTEGYYKMDFREKKKYSHVASTPASAHEAPDVSITRVRQLATTAQLSREARQNQRRLLATVDSVYTDLLKFNQLKFRKKQLKFSKSVIHDWGLFALEPIAADEMVIEYVGQQVRSLVADLREKKYEECGIGSSYLFRVDGECIVDATKCGNVARFINHSCNPNCYAKVVTVEGQKKIVIYSKQPIGIGEEITYDYKFPIEEDNKISCLCGAQGCRGYLN